MICRNQSECSNIKKDVIRLIDTYRFEVNFRVRSMTNIHAKLIVRQRMAFKKYTTLFCTVGRW
jgi:hypothetical protein